MSRRQHAQRRREPPAAALGARACAEGRLPARARLLVHAGRLVGEILLLRAPPRGASTRGAELRPARAHALAKTGARRSAAPSKATKATRSAASTRLWFDAMPRAKRPARPLVADLGRQGPNPPATGGLIGGAGVRDGVARATAPTTSTASATSRASAASASSAARRGTTAPRYAAAPPPSPSPHRLAEEQGIRAYAAAGAAPAGARGARAARGRRRWERRRREKVPASAPLQRARARQSPLALADARRRLAGRVGRRRRAPSRSRRS